MQAEQRGLIPAGEGETLISAEKHRVTIKHAGPEMVVLEHELPGGKKGPPLHFHKQHVDSFYVLEGELVLTVDGDELVAGTGSLVTIPPRILHTFLRSSSDHARFLNVHAPGVRFDEYMRRSSAAAARGASDAEMKRIAEAFDEFQP